MRQVLLRDGRAVVEEVPAPTLEPGRVLVRTAFSVLSAGTERDILAATESPALLAQAVDPDRLRRALGILRQEGPGGLLDRLRARKAPTEAAPGYAASGRVLAVGKGIADLPPGTSVACAGVGYACHAESLSVPRNLVVPVPSRVPLEEAAFATLGAIALQGVRRARIEIGECAVVLGLGLVGTLVAQILRAAGAVVLGFDADSDRAARARALGFEAYDLASRDPRDEVPRATGGMLADAVLVCAASRGSEVTNLALRLSRKKGRVVLVGVVGLDIDRSLMYEKELDLLMSTSYGPGRYDPTYEEKGLDYPLPYVRWTENRNMAAFLGLLATGSVQLRPIIDRVLPLEDAARAYDLIGEGTGPRPLGVLLSYGESPMQGGERVTGKGAPLLPRGASAEDAVDPLPAGTDTIGVALCGAGAFVKAAHLPALRGARAFSLKAVVAGTPKSARETARRFGIPLAATDLQQALEDPGVHLVLVGTRHHLHASQVSRSLRSGCHVLAEKPLCLDEQDLPGLLQEARTARRLLAVGFNRRYSALALRARDVLRRLRGPSVAVYRVNAGALPATHWVQDPEQGGGRVVGECCHFVDLLLFLIEEPIEGIEARALPSDGSGVVQSDSFAATILFRGGSRAVLVYTGLGDPGLPKERLEIFKGGAALALDDFRSLSVHGGPGGSLTLPQQDKGITAQWEAIARRLRGEPSDVITLAEIEAAMRATFRLDRAVRGER